MRERERESERELIDVKLSSNCAIMDEINLRICINRKLNT